MGRAVPVRRPRGARSIRSFGPNKERGRESDADVVAAILKDPKIEIIVPE
jgi:hypothetical protein